MEIFFRCSLAFVQRPSSQPKEIPDLPEDVLNKISQQVRDPMTIMSLNQSNRFFRNGTSLIRSELLKLKNKIDQLKNKIDQNAVAIRDISPEDISIQHYLDLAKKAVTLVNDPQAQRPYAITHIKLDKNGVTGLNPDDFMQVAQIAMKGNRECITNIEKLVNDSNYDQSKKDQSLIDCDYLFRQDESPCVFVYLRSIRCVLFGH